MELYAMAEELEETGQEIDFPSWWQAMITDAATKMVKAKHYLDFELKEPAIDAAIDALTGEKPHMGEPEPPMMEGEISAEEKLAGKIAKALKDMANKDASDQNNLKQARTALNKGNIEAAKKIAKPYLSEKIAQQLKSK
jgi:predicted phage-related endonuclease